MKKIVLISIFAAAFALMLSGCRTGEPVDHSVLELNYQLPGYFVQEQDQETANQYYNNSLVSVEDEDTDDYLKAEDYLALQWYDDGDYCLAVKALYVPHNNDDLEGALEAAGYDDKGSNYTTFDLEGGQGRYGKYHVGEDTTNYGFDILHNGILYSFTFYNTEELTGTQLDDMLQSFCFSDTAMQDRVVECGDITVSISGEYQELNFEKSDTFHDKTAFGQFGEARTDLLISYLDGSYGASDYADVWKEDLDDLDSSEIEEDFGKCYYVSGKTDGTNDAFALFEIDDKVYMVELLSDERDISLEDLQLITQTVKTN